MKAIRIIATLLLCIPALSRGDLNNIFDYCCRLGADWIERNTQCDNIPTPVAGIGPENQYPCITVLGYCCRKQLYIRSCDAGKIAAKQGQECLALSEESGGDFHRDCCDCCKLGITIGGMGMSCNYNKFGQQCDSIYTECCESAAGQKPPLEPELPSQTEIDDVDECKEFLNQLCAHICINTPASYRCACQEGFRLHPNQRSCMLDTSSASDRCRINYPCAHECRDTGVAIECSCRAGYRLLEDNQSCEDIDECILRSDTCNRHTESCHNTQGSYQCLAKTTALCPPGYKFNSLTGNCEDVNECAEKLDDCEPSIEFCFNTIGHFECQTRSPGCPPGFKQNPLTRTCEDIDECAEGSHNCNRERDVCVNRQGSFICQPAKITAARPCGQGYRLNTELRTCVDIDECDDEEDDCDHDRENCINTIGSFKCQSQSTQTCNNGYRSLDRHGCIDIDECAEGADHCNKATEICVNSPGTFSCQELPIQCQHGMQYNFDLRRCVDIDECQKKQHNCNVDTEDCLNTLGSFICISKFPESGKPQCSSGFRYSHEIRNCVDLDECLENTHNCHQEHQVCHNTAGSFNCRCAEGFQYNSGSHRCEDLNECILGRNTCQTGQRCENTVGSFICSRELSCGTGYTLNRDSGQCEDDNECQLATHNCGVAYTCRNTAGSFRCDVKTCPQGFRLNPHNGQCDRVECGDGMEPDNFGQCIDVNECLEASICRRNQRCINTIGSFRCQSLLNCGGGYELNEDGSQCIDIDECTKNIHVCPGGQICLNRPGGYVCQCPQGYVINRNTRQCEDIDECTRFANTACPNNAECQNSQGSYRCNCKEGFRNADDGRNCIDIDECERNPCQHHCVNVWGSYQCSCEQGYVLREDGRSCQDIDECSIWSGRGRLCIGQCINEPGSYSCMCPSGYTLQRDKRTCQDIDECKQGQCQGEHEICLNTRGSFKCNTIQCPQHYVRDTEHKNVDDGILCKKFCQAHDIDCILNTTMTITYQYIALPTINILPDAMTITQMQAISISYTSFSVKYDIVQGNQGGYFDVLPLGQSGVLQLIHPISGPLEVMIKLKMTVRSRTDVVTSNHIAIIYIYISEHEF